MSKLITYQNPKTVELVKNLYKDDLGRPIVLTQGQTLIFDLISKRLKPRIHCVSYTQYGKSLTVALAVLTRVATYPEKWAIVAPTTKKAKIIMGYIIDHIFDNEYTASKFELEKGENREQIKRERSKDRINFKISEGRLGEVFILSTEGRRTKDVMDALMGFGAPNVILDESSLVDDLQYAAVKRMLGGTQDNFIFEIGNPFRRNHFYRTSRDPLYYHINITWQQGVKEGRISMDFIDEMRKEANFGVLYSNDFPDEDMIDDEGYSSLFTSKLLDVAYVKQAQILGRPKLGCDVAGGGANYSVIVIRGENAAKILFKEKTADTMAFVGHILMAKDQNLIDPRRIYVDTVGLGKGVCDRLAEHHPEINAVNVGERAENGDKFSNQRAEAYWRMYEWLRGGGRLEYSHSWEELLNIKYKVQSDKRVRIMPKEDMLRRGIVSPDVADALMLTFVEEDTNFNIKQVKDTYIPTSEYEGGSEEVRYEYENDF